MEKLAQELGSRSSMTYDSGPQKCGTVCLEECQTDSPCCTTREKGKKGKSFFPGKPKTQPENGWFLCGNEKELASWPIPFPGFLKHALCSLHPINWYYQLTRLYRFNYKMSRPFDK